MNGSTGIAVGMTTNIPPHNLNELIDASCAIIDNPHIDLDSLIELIQDLTFPEEDLFTVKVASRVI